MIFTLSSKLVLTIVPYTIYIMRNRISLCNAVLRERFGISEKNKSIVSRVIKDTVEKGYIRLYDDATAPRYYRYVPYWA